MLSYAVAVLLSCLAIASSRESIRPMPTITNSLVNLGKMEVSFYFNGNGRDSSSHQFDRVARSMGPMIKPEPFDEPCPCSSMRNVKDNFINNPAGILNKLLTSNNFFSSNKDPFTSSLCCESHENIQEGTVIFELPSNPKNMKPIISRSGASSMQTNTLPISSNAMPMLPFLFDSFIPNKSNLPQQKTKSIEIFLFPKKDTVFNDADKLTNKKKDLSTKDNIQVVGDKEIKNNISLFKPVYPVVKKDLNLQEKNDKLKEKEMDTEKSKDKVEIEKDEGDQIIIEPAGKPNTL